MNQFKNCIMAFCVSLLCAAIPVACAADSDIITSPTEGSDVVTSQIVQKAISEIERNYAWDVERKSLEKNCIAATHDDKSGQLPIDACIAGMVAGLDGHSSYFDPVKYQEMKDQSLKHQENEEAIVVVSLFNGEIVYMPIPNFINHTCNKILLKTADLLTQSHSFIGLIIDLRNSDGGLLSSVIDVAGLFLPNKTLIVSVENHRASPWKRRFFTSSKRFNDQKVSNILKTVPLIALVNQNTAEGAELLAAALKENGRAKIIGRNTAKIGYVKNVLPLSGERCLKLTIGFLVTSSGSLINEDGVKVDIKSTEDVPANFSQQLEDDPVIKQAYAKFKFNK